ncbi:aromatic acid exporter family protein [Lagierella sp.]|uniref:aromatic acid exporter family protein n=1 Tax=Lagierella sp. TaxID=2849657 RepID=UPI00262A5327|nr:aromatic acid exporter family protein [Lagierella sp.]
MNSVISRTIKTALAAFFAIFIAENLGLQFSASAGIIAILSVLETRTQTLKGGVKRLISAILAILIGSLCFYIFGFKNWVFALYLLIFVPISFFFKVEIGLGPSSVLVTHLLAIKKVDQSIILNEIGLILIGTLLAFLTNIYAPNKIKKLEEKICEIDEKIIYILNRFIIALTKEFDIKTEENLFVDLDKAIEEASILANREMENLNFDEGVDITLNINIMKEQSRILKNIYEDLSQIPPEFTKGTELAEILKTNSTQITEEATVKEMRRKMEFMKNYTEILPAPQTREEFKIRSAVYQTMKSIDEFMVVLSSRTEKKDRLL